MLVLEILQIICSFLMLFFFIIKRAPIVLEKAQNKIKNIEVSNSKNKSKSKPSLKQKIFKMFRDSFIIMKSVSFDPLILYYMLYTAFAIIGMFNTIFSAILLLDIFSRFPQFIETKFFYFFKDFQC